MKVRVWKTASLNQSSKWNIKEGKIYEGNTLGLPEVGRSYLVSGARTLVTSEVKEIIDNYTFRTLNSIYHFEIVKDDKANTTHPGGLGESISVGEDVPKKPGHGGRVMGKGVQEEIKQILGDKVPFRVNI